MISYEFAKQLKDKGFLQDKWIEGRYYYLGDGTSILFDRIKDGLDERGWNISYRERLTLIPNLEELIYACGPLTTLIMLRTDSFVCFQKTDSNKIETAYSTPEGAVAHLWLELNKK